MTSVYHIVVKRLPLFTLPVIASYHVVVSEKGFPGGYLSRERKTFRGIARSMFAEDIYGPQRCQGFF